MLADPPYRLETERIDVQVVFNVFGSNNMKDTDKKLGDIVMPATQKNVFYCTTQIAFWYKVFALERKNAQDDSTEGSDMGGAERNESKSGALKPAFEIENFVLYYIYAVMNFKK